MKLHRKERVSQLMRDELATIILRELEFQGALVTLTEVEVSEDLENAKVKVSVIPHDKEKDVLEVLAKKRNSLQFMLHRKINIRPMPQIFFELDHGPEKAAIIEKDFIELEKKEGGGAGENRTRV